MSRSAIGWVSAFIFMAAASWAYAANHFGLPAPYEAVSEQYLVIQNKLAHDEFNGVPATAKGMLSDLDRQKSQSPGFTDLDASVAKLAAASDLITARAAFKDVSTNLVAQFKQDHISTGFLHEVYCPAARGCWIQTDAREPHNPYFGKERPNCGDVVENF